MHQTTVRFGADLWRALEDECSGLGVSVAQFVREAALARLMYMSGRRRDTDYEHALEVAGAPVPTSAPTPAGDEIPALEVVRTMLVRDDPTATAIDRGGAEVAQSSALWAQGRQARRRSQELRNEVARRRLAP
jgi:hypothetical protein